MLVVNQQAFAKLNLFLHITGRRSDGYHLLQSAFVRIDWSDTLRFERRDDGQLLRHDLGQPLPADDLCLQAARLLQHVSGVTWGVDIHIQKCIPSGAGMGGGSADAAAVLLALNHLWALNWHTAQLQTLALQLGADVPFFISEQHAWVEGIGEQVSPLVLPPSILNTPVAVLKPPAVLPTKDIFAHPQLPRQTGGVTPAAFLRQPKSFGHNDMEAVARMVCPEVAQALGILKQLFGQARMTGSGSAVFAWVPEHLDAQAAQQMLDQHLPSPQWVGRVCRLLPA